MRNRWVALVITSSSSSRIAAQSILQVNSLKFQLADLLEAEEEWNEAARVLMGISLEGQRYDCGPSSASQP